MQIVVDEWLLDYLCPGAQPGDKLKAINFINGIVKKCYKIIIKKRSPFVKKFYSHMKKYGWDNNFKARFKKLNELLFHNFLKTVIVDDNDVSNLPDGIAESVPNDDRYLVELAYSSSDKIIVTTDQRLQARLRSVENLKIYLIDEFITEFLAGDLNALP